LHKVFFSEKSPFRVSPYAACFTKAETAFELTSVFPQRAWGMTAKVSALPDSRVAGVTHALRRWGKTARDNENKNLEKDGGAASGLR
jgi:hypothetical protein